MGWYGDKLEDADWTLPLKPRRQGRNHSPVTQEEQQAYICKHRLVMFANIPQLRGTTHWVLLDLRSITRNIPVLQDGYRRKGLLSEDGREKQAFFIMQKAYKDNTVGKREHRGQTGAPWASWSSPNARRRAYAEARR